MAAEECKFSFNESELISSIGIAPVKQEIIKDEGITKRQYEFRRELSSEEMLSDDADENMSRSFIYLFIIHHAHKGYCLVFQRQ